MNLEHLTKGLQEGHFRIIGQDNFSIDEPPYVEGEEESYELALATLIAKQEHEKQLNGEDNELATTFFIINYQGQIVYPK